MRERGIQIVNNRSKSKIITENKILMKFVADYVKEKELKLILLIKWVISDYLTV